MRTFVRHFTPLIIVACALSMAAQNPATPATPAAAAPAATPEACKPDGWMAQMSLPDRIYLKSKKSCPEDIAAKDAEKSPFATPIDLQVGSKVALKGAEIFPRNAEAFFTTLDVDAVWEPGSDGKYTSTTGLRPTYTKAFTQKARGFPDCADPLAIAGIENIPGHSWQIYGDVRHRVGDFKKKDSQNTERVDQLLYGVGTDFRIFTFWMRDLERVTRTDHEYPRIALTYYRVRDRSESDQVVPSDVKAGHLQLAFSAEIPLKIVEGEATKGDDAAYGRYYDALLEYAFCPRDPTATEPVEPKLTSYYPWSLSFDLRASRVIDGDDDKVEPYADVAIKYQKPGSKLGYLARYRTGKDLGFEYNDEIIIGLLYSLFK